VVDEVEMQRILVVVIMLLIPLVVQVVMIILDLVVPVAQVTVHPQTPETVVLVDQDHYSHKDSTQAAEVVAVPVIAFHLVV